MLWQAELWDRFACLPSVLVEVVAAVWTLLWQSLLARLIGKVTIALVTVPQLWRFINLILSINQRWCISWRKSTLIKCTGCYCYNLTKAHFFSSLKIFSPYLELSLLLSGNLESLGGTFFNLSIYLSETVFLCVSLVFWNLLCWPGWL